MAKENQLRQKLSVTPQKKSRLQECRDTFNKYNREKLTIEFTTATFARQVMRSISILTKLKLIMKIK